MCHGVVATLRAEKHGREVEELREQLQVSKRAEVQAEQKGETLRRELEMAKQALEIAEEIVDKARAALTDQMVGKERQAEELKVKQELEEASIKLHSEIKALHQQLVVAAETSDKETCDHEIVMATLRGQVQREVQALKKDLEASQAAERQATEQGEALWRELERSTQKLKMGKDAADKARAGEEALAALKGQVEVEVRALHHGR
jgi:hypothetical protein